jgi:hypothetical protein
VSDWQERENVHGSGKSGFEQKPRRDVLGYGNMSFRSLRPRGCGMSNDCVDISLNMVGYPRRAESDREYMIIGGNQLYLL